MAKKKKISKPKTDIPRIYLWFTSFSGGDHCNTIGESAHEIAAEMTIAMEENLGEVRVEGKTKS